MPLRVALEQMDLNELNTLAEELEVCVRHYSACLVAQLAAREELEYEQEVKDLFFTRLHEVQTRMDEFAAATSVAAASSSDVGDSDGDEDNAKNKPKSRFALFGGGSLVPLLTPSILRHLTAPHIHPSLKVQVRHLQPRSC